MKRSDRPTAAQVRAALIYDPSSGIFTRRVSSGNQKAGSVAGTRDTNGHVQIRVLGRLQLAHRLAFVWMTGEWPVDQVDHIDGVRDNNRWSNLRQATAAENSQNRAPRIGSSSGVVGVHWCKRLQKWVAQIGGAKRQRLGAFDTKEAASEAYQAAKATLHKFNPVQRAATGATT